MGCVKLVVLENGVPEIECKKEVIYSCVELKRGRGKPEQRTKKLSSANHWQLDTSLWRTSPDGISTTSPALSVWPVSAGNLDVAERRTDVRVDERE